MWASLCSNSPADSRSTDLLITNVWLDERRLYGATGCAIDRVAVENVTARVAVALGTRGAGVVARALWLILLSTLHLSSCPLVAITLAWARERSKRLRRYILMSLHHRHHQFSPDCLTATRCASLELLQSRCGQSSARNRLAH